MGITGLYAELGPGERVSLAKLAHDHYVANGRPLRVAVDVAIWSFQMQNAQGGSNPALRTLYYRLTRLLSHPILPIFVFDGPSRPAFKRNKQVASLPSYVTSAQKKLISLFGFPYHVAPGEAEAECANLQKAGVVDATLSEDVDTLMFGCGLVLRNWSGEGSAAIPTHITVYDLDKIRRERKLTPEGMIMIALMSGGDYIPAGVSGCGIRTAAEAAKAGFGKDLCRAAMDDDEEGLKDWRERLIIELRTNKSKLFKRKNNTIQIPHSFPDKQVMGYYLSPVVSPATADIIKNGPDWEGWVDIPGLRAFVREMFEWKCKGGAKKMIRTLAPGLLVSKLLRGKSARDEQVLTGLVKQIHTRRVHHSTDGLPELRTSFIPATVVPIDLELEPEDGLDDKADSDDEEGVSGSDSAGERSKGKRRPKNYDPFTVERVWITEQALRTGLPKRVEEWEEALNKPRRKEAAPRTKPGTAGKRGRGTGAEKQAGAIEKFLKVSKPAAAVAVQASSAAGKDERGDESLAFVDLSGEPSPPRPTVNAAKKPTATARAVSNPAPKKPPAPKGAAQSPAKAARKAAAHAPSPAKGANPWSLSKRPATAAAAGAKAQGKPAEHQRSRSEDISSTSPTPVKKSSTSRPLQHTRSSASVWRDPLRCLEGSSAVSKPNASSKTKPTSRPKSSPAPQGVKCSPPPAKPVKAGQPHAIDSTPDPLAPLALHGEKRHRKLHSPSPVCKPQVIELTSSPPAADSCPGTPNKESTTQANRISESPSKKQKTPESVRRSTIIDTNNNPLGISGSPLSTATVDRANSDNKFAFANNTVRTYSGEFIESLVYGDHLAFFEQEALVGLDVSKLSPATSYLPSYNKEDKNTSSRVTTIDKVNRILDFSSMPPPFPDDDAIPLSGSPLSFPQHQLGLGLSFTHSRTNSNTSNLSTSDYSSVISVSDSPTRNASPVRDYTWITTTRGNFSPRKELKKVLEGVFPLSPPAPAPQSPSDAALASPIGLLSTRGKPANTERRVSPNEALQQILHTELPDERATSRASCSSSSSASTQPNSSSTNNSEGKSILLPAFEPGPPTPLRTRTTRPMVSRSKTAPATNLRPRTSAPAPNQLARGTKQTTVPQRNEKEKEKVQPKKPGVSRSMTAPARPLKHNIMLSQSVKEGGWKEITSLSGPTKGGMFLEGVEMVDLTVE